MDSREELDQEMSERSVRHDPPELEATPTSVGGHAAFAGRLLAWLGGARGPVLRLCLGERSLYAGLGMGVLLTAVFGGASAALAVSYVLGEPVARLWPVGVFWALTLANIDRLLLLITASKGRLLAMLPRLAISALLGFLIAEPLTLRIFQPEINAQIATTQQQAQQAQLASIQDAYQPKITADDNQINALNGQLGQDQETVNHFRFMAACEAGETDCSTSHRLGYGPYYYYYLAQAAQAQAHYNAVAPGIRSQITAQQADARLLHSQEVAAEQKVHAVSAGGLEWAAREAALDQLEARQGGVYLTVWLVRLAFVLVDLAPLIVKFLVVLFGKQVYDEIAEAARERDRVAAHRLREQARLERARVTRRADAEDEVDEAVVEAGKDQRIAAAYASAQPARGSRPAKARDARIPAMSLSEFARASRIHERMAVPMAPALSRVAWIGTGLIAGLALLLMLARVAGHVSVAGGGLMLVALLAVLSLAVYSRGFRRGPAWAQRAAFGAGLLGLAIPAVIVALNV